MAKAKTIELSEPIQGSLGTIMQITLRQPTFADFTDLGAPEVDLSPELRASIVRNSVDASGNLRADTGVSMPRR